MTGRPRVVEVLPDLENGRRLARKWGHTALVVGFTFIQAYGVMLALGVLRHDVSAAVPALGFWATWVVLWGAKALASVVARFWSSRGGDDE